MNCQCRLWLAADGMWLLCCEEDREQAIGRHEQLQPGCLVRFDESCWLTQKQSRGIENLHSSMLSGAAGSFQAACEQEETKQSKLVDESAPAQGLQHSVACEPQLGMRNTVSENATHSDERICR